MVAYLDGSFVKVSETEARLFETPWWRLYWHRVNPGETPARFKWKAKGKPQFPRGITIEERR